LGWWIPLWTGGRRRRRRRSRRRVQLVYGECGCIVDCMQRAAASFPLAEMVYQRLDTQNRPMSDTCTSKPSPGCPTKACTADARNTMAVTAAYAIACSMTHRAMPRFLARCIRGAVSKSDPPAAGNLKRGTQKRKAARRKVGRFISSRCRDPHSRSPFRRAKHPLIA